MTEDSLMEHSSNLSDEPRSGIQRKRWHLTVEPVIFLFSLATGASSVTTQSFYLQRICETQFNQSAVNCANLSHYPDQEAIAEGIAATYATYLTIVHSAPPIILAIFWGQLNDRLGSKNMMFAPLLGFTLSSALLYILSYMAGTSPALLLIAAIPIGLSGGSVTLTISMFKLIVHSSTEVDRTFRIGMAEAALLVGNPLGLFAGAALLNRYGFSSVFFASGVLEFMGVVYTFFFVVNDKPLRGSNQEVDETQPSSLQPAPFKLWSFESLKESMLICFKPGPNRPVVIALMAILCIRSFVITGDSGISFLYTRFKFQWTQVAYSAYKTFDGTLAAGGVLVVSTIASKYLHIRDSLIGIVAAIFFSVGCCVYAFAAVSWMMYLASSIQMCNGMAIIIVRSMVTQAVGAEEVGKALSFISIPENIMPFIASPVYNQLYVAAMHFFPGTTYLLSAMLNVIVSLIFLFVFFKAQRHEPVILDTSDESTDSLLNSSPS